MLALMVQHDEFVVPGLRTSRAGEWWLDDGELAP